MSSLILTGENVRPADRPETPLVPQSHLIRKSYPFTAIHHHEWDYHEDALSPEGEWRPKISELRHVPGGNGVVEIGRGPSARVDPSGAYTGMIRKGSIVIRPDDPRLGDYRFYQRRYALQGGGYFYVYTGVSVVLLNRGKSAVPRLDHGWMRGFQVQLLAGGLIDPMAAEVLNKHLVILDNRLREWDSLRSQGALTEDAYQRMVQDTEARMDRMRVAWDRQFGDLEPTIVQGAELPADPASLAVDGVPVVEEPSASTNDKGTLVQVAEGLERAAGPDTVALVRDAESMNPDTNLVRFSVETLRGYIAALRSEIS